MEDPVFCLCCAERREIDSYVIRHRTDRVPFELINITAKQSSTLLKLTINIPSSLTEDQGSALIAFASAAFLAGDMTSWMGIGKQLVEKIWSNDPLLGLRFAAVLAEVDWAGWKLVVSGLISRYSFRLPDVTENVLIGRGRGFTGMSTSYCSRRRHKV